MHIVAMNRRWDRGINFQEWLIIKRCLSLMSEFDETKEDWDQYSIIYCTDPNLLSSHQTQSLNVDITKEMCTNNKVKLC